MSYTINKLSAIKVCEHALAHNLPDRVQAAHRRGDLLDKRVILMQAWADYCASDQTAALIAQERR